MAPAMFLVSAIVHHISLLRLLPKSNFKMSTFQPNFLYLAPLIPDVFYKFLPETVSINLFEYVLAKLKEN